MLSFLMQKRKSAVNMKKRTNLSVNSVEKFISSNSYLSQIGIGLKIVFLLLFSPNICSRRQVHYPLVELIEIHFKYLTKSYFTKI